MIFLVNIFHLISLGELLDVKHLKILKIIFFVIFIFYEYLFDLSLSMNFRYYIRAEYNFYSLAKFPSL